MSRLNNIYSPKGHIIGFIVFLIIIVVLGRFGHLKLISGNLGSAEIGAAMCFLAGALGLFVETFYIIEIMDDIKSHIDKKKRLKSRSEYLDKHFNIYD